MCECESQWQQIIIVCVCVFVCRDYRQALSHSPLGTAQRALITAKCVKQPHTLTPPTD